MYCIKCGRFEAREGGLLCSKCVIDELETMENEEILEKRQFHTCSICDKEILSYEVIYCFICDQPVCDKCCFESEYNYVCNECLEEGE